MCSLSSKLIAEVFRFLQMELSKSKCCCNVIFKKQICNPSKRSVLVLSYSSCSNTIFNLLTEAFRVGAEALVMNGLILHVAKLEKLVQHHSLVFWHLSKDETITETSFSTFSGRNTAVRGLYKVCSDYLLSSL